MRHRRGSSGVYDGEFRGGKEVEEGGEECIYA